MHICKRVTATVGAAVLAAALAIGGVVYHGSQPATHSAGGATSNGVVYHG
jgi:hypothetical protein